MPLLLWWLSVVERQKLVAIEEALSPWICKHAFVIDAEPVLARVYELGYEQRRATWLDILEKNVAVAQARSDPSRPFLFLNKVSAFSP